MQCGAVCYRPERAAPNWGEARCLVGEADVHGDAWHVAPLYETLLVLDWAKGPAGTGEWDNRYRLDATRIPDQHTGRLAESWEQPDPLTVIFHVRKGVYWHDKPPMNGRELTADDFVYNFHRVTGTGSGFTETGQHAEFMGYGVIESITATDKYTVVFKLKEDVTGKTFWGGLSLMQNIALGYYSDIYPPEVIEEHGDAKDWRNLVGTGPYELTDFVEGSSVTYTKNPDYWGYDEKYPENRLPYIDRLRALIMPEVATQLAGLRTGRLDTLGGGSAWLRSLDQLESLQQTNPELVIWSFTRRSDNG